LLTIGETKAKVAPQQIRRILVTTDFSQGTADAVAYAFSIARETKAKVSVLHVLNDVSADISGLRRDPLIRSIHGELESLIPPGARDWCDVDTRVDSGLPFFVIPEILKKEKIDLLVMNIHGKSMLERAMIGSTAEHVVRTAGSPVLLIPPLAAPAKKKAKVKTKARKANNDPSLIHTRAVSGVGRPRPHYPTRRIDGFYTGRHV
jgi:nucleotide-binding universal stress UspA family protein